MGEESPWYERYFTADYWTYADQEYTKERTGVEVAYLAAVLNQYAPGRRVLDLACGVGRHSIGLAELGFEVTGVDISEYALTRARAAAESAGVRVAWHRADLLGGSDWGVDGVDAVIGVQAFGLGAEAEQLRLLRRVRALLAPGGVLVLDHSSIHAIARRYAAYGQETIGEATVEFIRHYEATTGRSSGQVRIHRDGALAAVLPDDVRLYTPAELRVLLARTGFDISTVDADFTAGAPVDLDTRYVQFVARPAPAPEPALSAHQGELPAGVLDLRRAPDEADLVGGSVAAAWVEVAGADPPPAQAMRRYDLADPYGGNLVAPVLARALSLAELDPGRVFTGAGATGLLHGLARLASDGVVLVDPIGHPELAGAAGALGSPLRTAPLLTSGVEAAVAEVARLRPSVTVLDRPGLVGRAWTVPDVAALARACERAGGVLVVDETCAGYLGPGTSCAALTDEVAALVVVRSMSKGFCCGGLRVGFAIASPALAPRLPEVLAPLPCGALALDVAMALLCQEDPLAPLRSRIAEHKPRMAALLAATGATTMDTEPRVPWLCLPGDEANRRVLAAVRLAGREVTPLDPAAGALVRLSVPLSPLRWEMFTSAMSAGGRDAPA